MNINMKFKDFAELYLSDIQPTGSIYLEDINSMKEMYSELIQVFGKVLHQFNEISEAIV